MMDLRYHLVSLTAVFLALAVGIVVGSSLGSSERQTALVQRLQQRFDRVMEEDRRTRAENEALRRKLEARERAERQLMSRVIQSRLAGTRMAIIVCGDGFESNALEELRQALSLAGTEVTSTTRLPGALDPLPPTPRPSSATGDHSGTPEDADRAAARTVTRVVLSGDTGGKLPELARANRAALEGSYAFPVRRLLVIAAPSAPAAEEPSPSPAVAATERLAATVLATAQELGARIVAAEPEETGGTAFLRAAAGQRLTTIDNIDTASGQIALVLALAEGARGSFGSKPGASQPMPPP